MIRRYANRFSDTNIDPCEIVRIESDTLLHVREMLSLRNPEFRPHRSQQVWDITPDPKRPAFPIRLHRDGVWRDTEGRSYALDDRPVKFVLLPVPA
jgi:hypothetical protein